MMKAEIISTGSELMSGETLNTNAQYLSKRLYEMGVEVLYHTTTDDCPEHMLGAIENAFNRVDLIVITGGLGPTDDDVTKEVIADFLGLPMYEDPLELERITNHFSKRHYHFTDNNKRQARIFKGGEWLINDIGTASGVGIVYKGRSVLLLPGPPFEMKSMFEKYIYDYVQPEDTWLSYTVNIAGIGESDLETRMKEAHIKDTWLNVATFAKRGYIEVHIFGKIDKSRELELKQEADRVKELILKTFPMESMPDDENSLEEHVVELLRNKHLKLAIVESCTGGRLSHRVVEVPHASDVFDRGLVCYSVQAKSEELAIPLDEIEKLGVYNESFANLMAKQLMEKSGADIAIATTGTTNVYEGDLLDPGQLYVAVADKHQVESRTYQAYGTRKQMIERMCNYCLVFLRERLLEMKP